MPSAGKPFCLAVLLAGVQVLPWLVGRLANQRKRGWLFVWALPVASGYAFGW